MGEKRSAGERSVRETLGRQKCGSLSLGRDRVWGESGGWGEKLKEREVLEIGERVEGGGGGERKLKERKVWEVELGDGGGGGGDLMGREVWEIELGERKVW